MKQIKNTCNALLGLLLVVLTFGSASLHATENTTYYHTDPQGTPIAATSVSGQVLWQEEYAPYGKRIGTDLSAKASSNPLWYTGQAQDNDAGLMYYGARWYDSSVGRFMGTDPVGVDLNNVHSFNRYAYANNSPYRYIDPNGESALDIIFLAADIYGLGKAVFTGGDIQSAAIDVGISIAGVLIPVPGAGQAIKAGRAADHVVDVAKGADNATGFLGSKGNQLSNTGVLKDGTQFGIKTRNTPTTINGRDFSGHALDQMQNRGIMPSVVENTLKTGQPFSTRAGTSGFYDSVNNIRVITNSETGRVVTVIPGAP